MFRIEYKIGYQAGQTKVYKTRIRASIAIHHNLWQKYGQSSFIFDKINAWMKWAQESNKPHNLTIVDTLRIEYTPE